MTAYVEAVWQNSHFKKNEVFIVFNKYSRGHNFSTVFTEFVNQKNQSTIFNMAVEIE